MSIEHEAKFRLRECLDMETRLRASGRLRTPWHFESNTVYDREGELARSGRLLRLRRALTSTLTFKEPAPGAKTVGVKSRIERECRVDDPGNMDAILLGLGANVQSLANTGNIVASFGGNHGSAAAIRDQSGTLNQLSNAGSIIASLVADNTDTTAVDGKVAAIDLSANTTGVTLRQ